MCPFWKFAEPATPAVIRAAVGWSCERGASINYRSGAKAVCPSRYEDVGVVLDKPKKFRFKLPMLPAARSLIAKLDMPHATHRSSDEETG